MKLKNEMGESPSAIAGELNRSHNTVLKYLRSEVFTRPDMKEIVEQLRNKEMDDLTVIGGKARQRIHEIFDNGKPALIPTGAALDRTFQQRRLLEGNSTQNIANLTAIIQAVHGQGGEVRFEQEREKSAEVPDAAAE